jgi:catechol 2,3-dioxygenase
VTGDIAHLGHLELYTNKFAESLDFFVNVYGLTESGRDGNSVYLRAFDDYEFHSLKLTTSDTTGVGHVAYRAASPEALARRVAIIEAMGCGIGWTDGDMGHGPSYRFHDPDGHVFEIYYDTVRYEAPEAERPALKNLAQRYHGRGVCPRRIDHLNLLATNVEAIRDFMQAALGSRVTEQIMLDTGQLAGCWFTVNNKT